MYYEFGTMVCIKKDASPFVNHEKGIGYPRFDVIGEIVGIHPSILSYTVRLSKYFTLVFSEDDIYGLPDCISSRRDIFHKIISFDKVNQPFYYPNEFESFVNRKKKGDELLRLSKKCIIYDRERPEFLPEYRYIPIELEQSLNKVHDDMINSLLYSVPTFYINMSKDEFKLPTKEEINAMFGVPKFEYKKIIFSGPCTIILWMDGTKTMARTSKEETFDPEKGVAICFMKKILGHTEANKILRKASKQYEDYIAENGINILFDEFIDEVKKLEEAQIEEEDD